MSEMIKRSSISFTEIVDDIDKYLQSRSNYQEMLDRFPASNITLIKELVAGFATYMVYKNHKLRDETYLSKAKLDTSIYDIARTFGYDIKRYNSPKVRLRYIDVPTKRNITSGTIFGYYEDYELVYFGPDRILEKLDTIDVQIGRLVNKVVPIRYNDNIFRIRLDPEYLESIDDDSVVVHQGFNSIKVSRDVEDYVIRGQIVDFSYNPYSTELLISDNEYNYGIYDIDTNEDLVIQYLETDGYLGNIDLNKISMSDPDRFVPIEVLSLGTNGQPIEHIRRLVPLFYSTQRRMVTSRDHKYVIEAHSYIKSAEVVRDDGVKTESELVINSSRLVRDTVITLSLSNKVGDSKDFTIILDSNDPLENLFSIRKSITMNKYVRVISHELDEDGNGIIKLIDRNPREPSSFSSDDPNISQIITVPGEVPGCCTVNAYYIKYNTEIDPIILTPYEQLELSSYINYYKMISTRIVLIPAQVVKKELSLTIDLVDGKYYTEVVSKIKDILSTYELILNTEFLFSDFLTKSAQIEVVGPDGSKIHPIRSIIPTPEIGDNNLPLGYITDYDEPPYIDKYLKFTKIDITLVDRMNTP